MPRRRLKPKPRPEQAQVHENEEIEANQELKIPPSVATKSNTSEEMPKQPTTFSKTIELNYFVYRPQGEFVPLLDFVWAEENFRKALKTSLNSICSLSGSFQELKAEPKSSEVKYVLKQFFIDWKTH